jgi:hypothetical protein
MPRPTPWDAQRCARRQAASIARAAFDQFRTAGWHRIAFSRPDLIKRPRGHILRGSSPIRPSAGGYLAVPLVSFVISDLSYNTTFNNELWISSFPLYLIEAYA